MLIYTPTATRLPMPKKLFFAPTLNTPRKKKKTENVWSYAKCTHRNPNGKINKSHKSISNGTTFTAINQLTEEFCPFCFYCELQRKNKGGLCI